MVLHEDDEHRRQCRAGRRSERERRGGRGGGRVSGGGRGGHRGGGWCNDRRCGHASIAAVCLATGAAGGCALPALGPRTHEHLACESSARAPGTARGAVSEGGRSVSACVRETVQLLRSTRLLAVAACAIALVPSRLDLRGVDEQEDESKQREERPDTPHGPQARGPCLRASIMVGCPSGYGGFPYHRNTFAPDGGRHQCRPPERGL